MDVKKFHAKIARFSQGNKTTFPLSPLIMV